MARGTTPDYQLKIPGYDLTGTKVFATVKQLGNVITKTGEDVTVTYTAQEGQTPGYSMVEISLTQEETLTLRPDRADVQVRWVDSDEKAYKTDIKNIDVTDVLLEKVIRYANDPA